MNGADRQFVDTNVLIYAHDRTAGKKCETAREIVRNLWRGRRGCVSVQILQEFYVAATRKTGLAPEQARRVVSDLQFWRVHRPTASDVLAAIDIHQQHGLSFWDAMVLQSAHQVGCSVLWSEDLQQRDYDGIEVRNPFANEP